MPWQNNGGGDRGPWGQGPRRGGGGQEPPNIDDLLRKGQDKFRTIFSGGGGKGFSLILLVVVAGWLATGIYKVNTNEAGVVLRFGEWVDTTPPGLHYHLPVPIETVYKPKVTEINQIDIGVQGGSGGQIRRTSAEASKERQMLTGDENIVDVDFSVLWKISDPAKFLFNVENQNYTIRSVAQSAVRDIIAQTPIQKALTAGRSDIEQRAQTSIQKILDTYDAGVLITQVKLTKVDPPAQVIEAFREVQRAEADREKAVNQAQAYRNDIVPRARGEAAKMLQEAEAYRAQVMAKADGETARFLSIYEEYKKAKDVTRKRMYLETMEEILAKIDKVLVEKNGGVIPYLPLPELKNKQ